MTEWYLPPSPPEAAAEEDVEEAVIRQGSSETDYLSDFFGSLSQPEGEAAEAAATSKEGSGGSMEQEEISGIERKSCGGQMSFRAGGGRCGCRGGGGRDAEADRREKRKRNRTSEMHNLTERRRRDKIKEKLKALQDLIPNSQKLDRASLLDDAILYMKSLQLQLQIMSGTNGTFQIPHVSPAAMQYLQMSQFYPFSPFVMNCGMGMTNMGSTVHSPMLSFPSALPTTSWLPAAGAGLSHLHTFHPSLSVQQMPIVSSMDVSAAAPAANVPVQVSEQQQPFCPSDHVNASYQQMRRAVADAQGFPMRQI